MNSVASPLTRRKFVQNAGTAAGILAATPHFALAGEPATDRKIRIGIIGGRFGATFQFHEHPNCVVAAVSDLRPERRAALQKVYKCTTAYESLESLLRDKQVEAVFLATPAPDHVRHVTMALKAGKHVLCAVPAAMTLEECRQLVDTVKSTGLTYMMAETSHWQQPTISARKFFQEGRFGTLYHTESMYHHAGLESLWFEGGKPTWRHGLAPMNYPTHCTAHLISVTGERLTEVSCLGWGDNDPLLQGNLYGNPFWNETAQFKTNRGHSMQVQVWWRGAHRGGERARYYGDKMSFFFPDPNGIGAVIVRSGQQKEKDSGGFERTLPGFEPYAVPSWWNTDLLPAPFATIADTRARIRSSPTSSSTPCSTGAARRSTCTRLSPTPPPVSWPTTPPSRAASACQYPASTPRGPYGVMSGFWTDPPGNT
jgi:predicted dehydrogenase